MIKKILFASDFTGITTKAESYAMNIAKAMGAEVTVLHAVEPIADSTSDSAVEKFLDTKRKNAETKADKVAERFREEGVSAKVHVEINKRWKSIIDTSKEGDFDLVILGSHKIQDGDKVYLGTTTHKVFFAADLPLLVVPAG